MGHYSIIPSHLVGDPWRLGLFEEGHFVINTHLSKLVVTALLHRIRITTGRQMKSNNRVPGFPRGR